MTARRSSSPPRGAGSGAPVTGDLRRREQLRQQLLASAVLARFDAPLSPVLAGWLQQDGATARRGVAAYRANAQASAHAALAAAYPTLQQMLGDESFETLARVYRLRHPATRGDLAWYGEAVPALVEHSEDLQDWPWLADSARLDWAVHRASHAADAPAAPETFDLLAAAEPNRLRLVLHPALVRLASPHPIVSIWHAHRAQGPARDAAFEAVRTALAGAQAQTAVVCRHGWQVSVAEAAPGDAAWFDAVEAGATLAEALDAAGGGFDLADWLARALKHGWLLAVHALPAGAGDPPRPQP